MQKYLTVEPREAIEWTCPNPQCSAVNYCSLVPVEKGSDPIADHIPQPELFRFPVHVVCKACQFKYAMDAPCDYLGGPAAPTEDDIDDLDDDFDDDEPPPPRRTPTPWERSWMK